MNAVMISSLLYNWNISYVVKCVRMAIIIMYITDHHQVLN